MVCFTRKNINRVLNANEGFKVRVCSTGEGWDEENLYTITGGVLQKQLISEPHGKISICDFHQTRGFLLNNATRLNLNI